MGMFKFFRKLLKNAIDFLNYVDELCIYGLPCRKAPWQSMRVALPCMQRKVMDRFIPRGDEKGGVPAMTKAGGLAMKG
jgi:hypothetical protein